MRWVLVYEHPTPLNQLAVEPHDELHVSYALSQLLGFSLAVRDEGLKLAECHAGRAPYQNQRLLLVDVLFGSLPMLWDVEVPARGEVHGISHLHAKLDGLFADSRWREDLTHVDRAQAVRQGVEAGVT